MAGSSTLPSKHWGPQSIPALRSALEAVSDPAKAAQMAAYMLDRFPFLGVTSPLRRAAAKSFVAGGKGSGADPLLEVAAALFAEPEREFHYVACDLLRRYVNVLTPAALPQVETLIRTNSWWDTVDALAAHVVGALVHANRELSDDMDQWIDDDDFWIARTAILHQLGWKSDTDADRLFGYVDRRASDTEFFIRKSLGWALRDYARTNPDRVALFVAERADTLSGLTRREATKHLV